LNFTNIEIDGAGMVTLTFSEKIKDIESLDYQDGVKFSLGILNTIRKNILKIDFLNGDNGNDPDLATLPELEDW